MPTLKILAACERTIFDQEGPVSLIGIFQKMFIPLQAAPFPDKAISPSLWTIFTMWEMEPKELGQEFTQIVKVFAPDDSIFVENTWAFKNDVADNTQMKIKIRVPSLPIWKEGDVIIRVWLKDTENELGSFRFAIRYLPKVQDAKSVEPDKT